MTQLQLHVPNERGSRGEDYLPAFERTLTTLVQWLGDNAYGEGAP